MTGPDTAQQRNPGPGLVAVVATVKGPAAQVSGFVRSNLRAGADHLVVLVDDADPDVLQALADDPEIGPGRVTALGSDAAYWTGLGVDPVAGPAGGRPASLNLRQTIGANLASSLLSCVPRFAWLFHLDLDERLHLDKGRLLGLDPGVRVVALDVLEAVSTETPRGPTRYKRRPTDEELAELHRRGVIGRLSPHAYFRGHYTGKRGIRPDPRVGLGIHNVKAPGGSAVIEPVHADWLQMLHDESHTLEEFVRKWQALADAGAFGQKIRRQRLGKRVAAILEDQSVDDAVREQRLRRLYRRYVADDAATLEELGLLTSPDPAWSAYQPQPLTGTEQATLREVAAVLASAPKRAFAAGGLPAMQLLERLHDRQALEGGRPLVVAGLRAALARAGAADALPDCGR